MAEINGWIGPALLRDRDLELIAHALDALAREGDVVVAGDPIDDLDMAIEETWQRVHALAAPTSAIDPELLARDQLGKVLRVFMRSGNTPERVPVLLTESIATDVRAVIQTLSQEEAQRLRDEIQQRLWLLAQE